MAVHSGHSRFGAALAAALCCSAGALGQAIYSNIPSTLAGNYPSLGYQATQTAEFGDRVTFGGTNRSLKSVTVTMSSWAHTELNGNQVSYTHPLTFNIYNAGVGTFPGTLIGTVTQNCTIPFRPNPWNDPTDGHAFGGIAFNVNFDFSSLHLTLPNSVVFGLAFNTQSWGANPIGVDGPYNSLNFALNTAAGGGVTAGTNNDLDDLFWNTSTAAWYTDGGAAGVGVFRQDTAWTGYTPMVQFNTTAITLTPGSPCAHAGDPVVVSVNMANAIDNVVGGQFFLQYDPTVLQFVSAAAGDAPFTLPVYSNTATSGQIDYAVGVPGGGPGTSNDTTMARFTFTALHDVCNASNLVTFRSHSPASRLTNNVGAAISAELVNMPAFTIDSVPPSITCPSNITVNADAGLCTAVLNNNESFDSPPVLGPTEAPGVYYTDRYPPAGFTSAFFDGGNRLKESISSADSAANRPPAYSDVFYNTQGRSLDVNLPEGQTLGIDLYVDPTWIGAGAAVRRADVWGVAYDGTGNISSYPIIGFTSNDPNDAINPTPANPTPRWRVWDDINGVWIDLPQTVTSGWHRLEITPTATSNVYRLDHSVVSTLPNSDATRIKAVLIQAYNFGQSYDVYWDNLTTGPSGPVAIDTCSTHVDVSYARSDNPLLTLQDPFPTGTTTVTWTATDSCGNSNSCAQTVTVNASNTLLATVQLESVDPGTFTRCISFGLPTGGCTTFINQEMTFTNGVATAAIDIPCGTYTCLTARDRLHTLRRTNTQSDGNFTIVGANYVADFTGSRQLIGGNLNDDEVIDILDFGAYVGQFGASVGASTTCSTSYPHADISGNGTVGTEDFTYIQTHFLNFNELDCCGGQRPPGRPSISTAELVASGHPEMVVADLNHDGWVDQADVAIFANGGVNACGSADFNCDGDIGTDADIAAFFSCMAGNCPAAPCASSADFNHDGDIGTDADIESFFRVLAGGHC